MHQRFRARVLLLLNLLPGACLLDIYSIRVYYSQDADSVVGDDERRNQAMVHGGWSLLVVGTLVEQFLNSRRF
jgi:hypothetical protein